MIILYLNLYFTACESVFGFQVGYHSTLRLNTTFSLLLLGEDFD